jgi:hypothetical protein
MKVGFVVSPFSLFLAHLLSSCSVGLVEVKKRVWVTPSFEMIRETSTSLHLSGWHPLLHETGGAQQS